MRHLRTNTTHVNDDYHSDDLFGPGEVGYVIGWGVLSFLGCVTIVSIPYLAYDAYKFYTARPIHSVIPIDAVEHN